jgi:outer membrane protein OmpA-like peptidoglycan-associated protein
VHYFDTKEQTQIERIPPQNLKKFMMNNFKTLVISACIGCLLSTTSFAKEEKVFTEDNIPSSEEIAKSLMGTAPDKSKVEGKSRSLGFGIVKTKKNEPISFSFPIKFDYNSSTLNPNSLAHLKKLGTALNLGKMVDKKIMIVGHTDGSGSKDYNLDLSRKRSKSVKEFLVSNYQIDPTRIKTSGKGESDTLPGKPRNAPTNRRVEFYGIQ